jgi:hypothetical protein
VSRFFVYMRVLVFCPCYPKFPRVYARTLQGIFALEWPEPLPIVFQRSGADVIDELDDIASKYNEARRLTLDGGFDALFCVEADMIVPPDALVKLAAVDADVVGGLYVSRHDDRIWYVYDDIYTERSEARSKTPDMDPTRAREVWGNVVTTVGGALGCTLIHRRVLEKVSFRTEGAIPNDWWFAIDVKRAGFVQKAHCGVVCGHIDGERHVVIYPDIEAPGLFKETAC